MVSDDELIALVRSPKFRGRLLPFRAGRPGPKRDGAMRQDWHVARQTDAQLIEAVRNSQVSHSSFTRSSNESSILGIKRTASIR